MADPTPAPPPDPAATPTPSPGEVKEILAKMAEFAQLLPQQPAAGGGNSIDFLRDVPVTITAQLGHVVMPISDILKLGPGAVVELEEMTHQPIALAVRGVPFATGEVVVVDDRFAVRIKNLLPPRSAKPGG
jgi:flagellar motor switch protein FliN/FliY